MENKIDVSVILPIKSSKSRNFDEYFNKAIQSLKNQKVGVNELVIVHTQEESLINYLSEYNFEELNVKLLLWTEEPNFCSQLNFGVEKCSSEWVSFFEFDDEYASIWFKNVKDYMDVYPNVKMFLPVVVDTDEKTVFAGFTNEATFAANFTQEMGILTNETLLNYQNFQTSGSVIKKSAIIDFGGMKPSMRLTFIYEFLLRMTYNSVLIMTIPRLGYKHTNLREGSIFWNYKYGEDKITDEEVSFWIQSAKKEYFFKDDRVIKYEQTQV